MLTGISNNSILEIFLPNLPCQIASPANYPSSVPSLTVDVIAWNSKIFTCQLKSYLCN